MKRLAVMLIAALLSVSQAQRLEIFYSRSAYDDYTNDRQVGSLVHGAVANETFMSEFTNVLEGYLSSSDAAQAGAAAQALAIRTGIGSR